MAAGGSEFGRWRRELKKLGFAALGTGGRKGLHCGRSSGSLTHAVAILVDPGRQEAFNIQLTVNMPLRCSEPLHDVIILAADLSPDEVRVQEPWVHDPSLTTWWPSGESDRAWTVLTARGIPWLERHAAPDALSAYFERRYRYHEDAKHRSQESSRILSMARRIGLVQPTRTAHDQYLLWLAMLYEEQGDLEGARARLDAYAAELAGRMSPAEKARLERHRQAIGSPKERASLD